MSRTIASFGFVTIIALAPLAFLAEAGQTAAASTYKFDYVPKRSDSYQDRMRKMNDLSKERARASAEWMRRHHRSLW